LLAKEEKAWRTRQRDRAMTEASHNRSLEGGGVKKVTEKGTLENTAKDQKLKQPGKSRPKTIVNLKKTQTLLTRSTQRSRRAALEA